VEGEKRSAAVSSLEELSCRLHCLGAAAGVEEGAAHAGRLGKVMSCCLAGVHNSSFCPFGAVLHV
jgi:hypothetical protein